MIHRILGYLGYYTAKKTRYLNLGTDWAWHVAFVLGHVLLFYEVDILLIYWAITRVNPGPLLIIVAAPVQLVAVYAYYRYKRSYLRIYHDKSYEEYSAVWAVLFLVLPFILFFAFIFFGKSFHLAY